MITDTDNLLTEIRDELRRQNDRTQADRTEAAVKALADRLEQVVELLGRHGQLLALIRSDVLGVVPQTTE